MPHYSEPICGTCKQKVDPMRLYIKKVVFAQYGRGRGSRPVKSVVVAHICDTCMLKDETYNTEPRTGPGHTSHAKKRIEERSNGE